MVLPAVLRNPARYTEQALRRDGARGRDHYRGLSAVARYVAGALGPLSPALSAVLLGLCAGLHWTGLARFEAGGRRLCHRRPHSDRLLLHPLPDHLAAAW